MDDESLPIPPFDALWVMDSLRLIAARIGWRMSLTLYHSEVTCIIEPPSRSAYTLVVKQEGDEAVKVEHVTGSARATAVDEESAVRCVFDMVLWAEIDAITGGR